MYESVSVVGERGQITIPKSIREIKKIRAGERVIVKIDDSKIVVEKMLEKKDKEALLKEYYQKYRKLDEKISEEWLHASKEADEMLDEY